MEMKTANNEIRQKNRSAIFQLFLEQEGVSRQDLVDKLGLSLPTVTNNLQQLQQEGLITQTGTLGNTGGRRARLYSLESSARTAIGLEITRHHLTAVALDLRGTIIASKRRRLDFARTDSYYRELGSMVQQIVASAELKEESILGVGIGVPGLVTPDHREIFYGMVLGFTGASCEEFSKYIPYPTAFFHDTDAACFAEIWNDSGIRNVFYIMLSASVGGAIYLGGKQYGGTNLRAGEVGHLTAVPNGRQCYCGRRGCVDSYCAASVLSSATNGDLKRFFQQLREGDPATEAIWQEYVGHLASAVANIRMLFDCDIIIGGYVGSYIGAHIGQTAVVTGAGCIGLVSMMALKAQGVSRVIVVDIMEKRLEKALELGADGVINAKQQDVVQAVLELTGGMGCDLVVETAGTEITTRQAIHMTRKGATIVLVGYSKSGEMTLPMSLALDKELTFKTVFRYRHVYPMAIDAVAAGKINLKGIVTDIFELDDIQNAMDRSVADKANIVKAVVKI